MALPAALRRKSTLAVGSHAFLLRDLSGMARGRSRMNGRTGKDHEFELVIRCWASRADTEKARSGRKLILEPDIDYGQKLNGVGGTRPAVPPVQGDIEWVMNSLTCGMLDGRHLRPQCTRTRPQANCAGITHTESLGPSRGGPASGAGMVKAISDVSVPRTAFTVRWWHLGFSVEPLR